ncbi:hypothetical protein HID58_080716 [Brassica napus]|uniref:Uncharacterized protein n=2 Tax=Brassica TaxID=3705 RepID=A0ABQ7Y8U7_BRANA|nr:hypothetical protein HID58_080716 [Brassica napus]
MDIERELHMTDYARNSSVQKKASDKTKHITLETVQQLYKETRPKSLKIADLGCSSGPNTLSTIRDIIKAVKFAHHLEIPNQPLPEFSILLNDLRSNDFNSIFKSLPDFHTELKRDTNYGDCPSVFIAANPGSFYGRLFPEKTIHFIYIPLLACTGFPRFLQLFPKLTAVNVPQKKNSFFCELLARSIADLIAQGETEQEKLDSYENHFYAPSAAETEGEVNKEGSFELEKLEMIEVANKWGQGGWYQCRFGVCKDDKRASQGSMLAQHFGEEILDKMFDTYARTD